MDKLSHTRKVIGAVDAETNAPLGVFMSFGKDSLAMADLVCRYSKAKEIIFVYKFLVQNLRHIEEKRIEVIEFFSEKYPEKTFRYFELPEPDTLRKLKLGVFCDAVKIRKIPKSKDLEEEARQATGADWFCWGMKQQDSLDRMVTLQTYRENAILDSAKRFFPLAKWSHEDVKNHIKTRELPEPINYGSGNMNGLSLDLETQNWLAARYPDDLERVRNVFPYFYV